MILQQSASHAVDYVKIIAAIGCIDLLCLINYIQLYSWLSCITVIFFYDTLHYIVHTLDRIYTPFFFHVCTVE